MDKKLTFCKKHNVMGCIECFPRPVNDKPKEEILELMNDTLKRSPNARCFIKWTCEKCGERCTSDNPDVFHEDGYIHEECGHMSHPTLFGLRIEFRRS